MKGLIEMIKKNGHIVAILFVIAGIAGFGFKGCSPEQRAETEKQIRVGVRVGAAAAVAIKDELDGYCRAELLKPESCAKAQPHANKIADIAGRIDTFVKEHPKLTPENRDELLALVDELIGELDALESEGVIEFKDPEKRRKFLLALAGGRSSIRIARVALQEIPHEQASPSPAQ